MKAVDETLGTLLSRERRYLIPTYQRDYEWTEEGQWQLLIDDIFDVASRLREARQKAAANGTDIQVANDSVGPHFLGALVLEGLPQTGAEVARALVIDGQQRLTTVNLLLRSLTDVLSKNPELANRARQVRKQILILDDGLGPDEQYKLWPRRRDREAWRLAMAEAPAQEDHVYHRARTYFADRIVAEFDLDEPGGSAGSVEGLESLVDAILQKLKIVVVDLDTHDDAQLIFEVLNGRQTPLSAADLVKNLLFMKADAHGQQLDDLYDRYWSPLDDTWWSQQVGRGHAARGRRDQMLATWLTVETADEVNLGHLYGEARKFLTSDPRDLETTLQSIHEMADNYRAIYERQGEVDPGIAEIYTRMENLGITTLVPLFAWLSTQSTQGLSPADHKLALGYLDSYVMRRLITGGQTRGYGRVFLDVLQKAKQAEQAGQSIPLAIREALLAAPQGLAWPDDQEVIEQVTTRKFYGQVSQERIRRVLGPIDRHLQAQRIYGEQPVFDYDKLTIEHVLPREWKAHWPVSGDDEAQRELAAGERERHVHRLGNLTLVTARLNPSMSNAEWSKKRDALKGHSQLALNADIVREEAWDEDTITKRGQSLGMTACKIWVHPSTIPSAD